LKKAELVNLMANFIFCTCFPKERCLEYWKTAY
jgi:hypothetical protein